ncbi:SpoIID/LytB domain-containing protein [Prolixibacter denitrificans]|uniref:Amidase n=1 Tax=Prolixibacter denitrificans TaxID=1541063 RepID=A0A2P8CIJ8_9BACT|nr:SpoIID/LytB domain-containing protein [Prolixibacter denitrificans]PSK84800.1 SpoIID/LytB domain protein [Prolixibacter denitrificans]GET20964.1 amidase [Prolixibacter denitrificans]
MQYNNGNEPDIRVGIMAEKTIEIELEGVYQCGSKEVTGKGSAFFSGNEIHVKFDSGISFEGEKLVFQPTDREACSLLLHDVTIGINFHWERKEDQKFRGGLELIREGENIRAINLVPVEQYLVSVISSEMSATSSMDLLKAHAVISRSWLLAQVDKHDELQSEAEKYVTTLETDDELIRWYDREDHTDFDVCADDHCQRYQGITRVVSENAATAIRETFGEALTSNERIADARFSKSCGGISESFENCWEPVHHPYLVKIIDNPETPEGFDLDLTVEINAERWIRSNPPAFCNTTDAKVLSQVLNNYDQETTDFYRWKVEYSQEEISALIKKRTGIDFGNIKALVPVERGDSARLIKLRIEGTKKTLTIGKELEIRKALSTSHLYSSAFVVDTEGEENGLPAKFILTGAGWGHGVGLCQIGAAVMGEKGYTYQEILAHYFKDALLEKVYS